MMTGSANQHELTEASTLLNPDGTLTQVGWARQPLLDCNLEEARFYRWRMLQRWRIKRWDYYGVTTPTHYFSITLADLGYAGQAFAYLIDLTTGGYHEETLTLPFSRGITLPRNSTAGTSHFDNGKVTIAFEAQPTARLVTVRWADFGGRELAADLTLDLAPEHESMVIVIPITGRRFYYNRKVNCIPVQGRVRVGDLEHSMEPGRCLANLDWGRGVWEYRSFWVWASASGFLPDGQTVGLNLGFGFGDTSAATENALILNGRVHKLGQVDFSYDNTDFRRPWQMRSRDGRLDLTFRPVAERVAVTNLLLITSEVHQLFGRYDGTVVTDSGEEIQLSGLVGFAEEHHARW
jgi:hypothetical protein